MVAGAGVMPVPDAHLLLAMGRAYARTHVEHDAFRRAATVHKVDPLAGQIGNSREVLGGREPLRLGPSGSLKPHSPEPPCPQQTHASPDRGAGAPRHSHPRIRQGDPIPTVATTP